MRKLTAVWLAIFLGGCATGSLKLIEGKYYWGGDSNCVRYRILSESRIMCENKDGIETGYRDAYTDQQLQMYMHEQQQRRSLDSLLKPNPPTNTYCYKTFGGGMNCSKY
jgi:hypothetical protein